jgi:hypothetical protein
MIFRNSLNFHQNQILNLPFYSNFTENWDEIQKSPNLVSLIII